MLVASVVAVAAGVDVDTLGVSVDVAPITTGVAVNMEGVSVEGRNGVGGLLGSGWIIQPLQADKASAIRIRAKYFFISSPPHHCIPLYRCEQSPQSVGGLLDYSCPSSRQFSSSF